MNNQINIIRNKLPKCAERIEQIQKEYGLGEFFWNFSNLEHMVSVTWITLNGKITYILTLSLSENESEISLFYKILDENDRKIYTTWDTLMDKDVQPCGLFHYTSFMGECFSKYDVSYYMERFRNSVGNSVTTDTVETFLYTNPIFLKTINQYTRIAGREDGSITVIFSNDKIKLSIQGTEFLLMKNRHFVMRINLDQLIKNCNERDKFWGVLSGK